MGNVGTSQPAGSRPLARVPFSDLGRATNVDHSIGLHPLYRTFLWAHACIIPRTLPLFIYFHRTGRACMCKSGVMGVRSCFHFPASCPSPYPCPYLCPCPDPNLTSPLTQKQEPCTRSGCLFCIPLIGCDAQTLVLSVGSVGIEDFSVPWGRLLEEYTDSLAFRA